MKGRTDRFNSFPPRSHANLPDVRRQALPVQIQRTMYSEIKEGSHMKQTALTSLIAAFSFVGLVRLAAADPPPVSAEKEPTETADNAQASNQGEARNTPRKDKTPPQVPAPIEAVKPNTPPTTTTYHKFKIDVAYIDMASLFKQSTEFNQKRDELKQEIDRAQKEVGRIVDEIRRKQNEYDGASKDDAARLYQEIKQLKQKQEKLTEEKQKEFAEEEARIYQHVFDRCRAEVARYAQENDIRAVRQWRPTHEREARDVDKAGTSPHDAAEVIQRLNRDMIYQADEEIFVTNDITPQILKRLNHEQREASDPATAPAGSDAPPAATADHKSKIEIAYIDMGYVFRHFDEFKRKREELKRQIALTEKEVQRMVDEIRRKQGEHSKASREDAPRLYRELTQLAQKAKTLRQQKQKEFLEDEARIYQQTFDHCRAEVARYAKEHEIGVVRRWNPKGEREAREFDKRGTPPSDPAEILKRLNRNVIFQADERAPITDDISKEIVNRLNRGQPDQSASAATTPK